MIKKALILFLVIGLLINIYFVTSEDSSSVNELKVFSDGMEIKDISESYVPPSTTSSSTINNKEEWTVLEIRNEGGGGKNPKPITIPTRDKSIKIDLPLYSSVTVYQRNKGDDQIYIETSGDKTISVSDSDGRKYSNIVNSNLVFDSAGHVTRAYIQSLDTNGEYSFLDSNNYPVFIALNDFTHGNNKTTLVYQVIFDQKNKTLGFKAAGSTNSSKATILTGTKTNLKELTLGGNCKFASKETPNANVLLDDLGRISEVESYGYTQYTEGGQSFSSGSSTCEKFSIKRENNLKDVISPTDNRTLIYFSSSSIKAFNNVKISSFLGKEGFTYVGEAGSSLEYPFGSEKDPYAGPDKILTKGNYKIMGSYKSPFSLAKKASEIGFKDNNLFVLSGGGFDYNERFTIAHQTSSGKIETIQVPNSEYGEIKFGSVEYVPIPTVYAKAKARILNAIDAPQAPLYLVPAFCGMAINKLGKATLPSNADSILESIEKASCKPLNTIEIDIERRNELILQQ